MNAGMQKVLYWAPRVLGVLFALFISVFALDVFGEGYGVGETILALFMHLIPTFLVILILVIAWRRELVGALLFVVLALVYIGLISEGESWGITAPLLVIGALFLLDWFYVARQHPR